jgi:hypothetical protein
LCRYGRPLADFISMMVSFCHAIFPTADELSVQVLTLDSCFGIQGRGIHARMSKCLTELPDPEATKRLPAWLALLAGWVPQDMRGSPAGPAV